MKRCRVLLAPGRMLAAVALVASACTSPRDTDAEPPVPLEAADVKRDGCLLVNDVDPSVGRGTISLVRADGSADRLLTDDGISPSWTPDGRIIFASSRSGSQQIWIMDADGGNALQLGELAPSMMPIMPQLGRNGLVVFMGLDEDTAPDGNTGIWVMNEDGSDLRELTRGMQPFLAASGEWIAFTLQTDEPYHRQIWRIDTDGTDLVQLTFLGDPDYPDANAPNISPDETTVAFFSGKESARMIPGAPGESVFEWGYRNVATVPATGGERTTLTRCHPVRSDEELMAATPETGDCIAADNPAWSPDGGWLIFDIGFSTGTETWLVDVNGDGFQSFVHESRGVTRVALRYCDEP